jgi:TolB protein
MKWRRAFTSGWILVVPVFGAMLLLDGLDGSKAATQQGLGQQSKANPRQAPETPLASNPIGMFEGHGDVGDVSTERPGSAEYDTAKDTYTVSGSGENMWFGSDAFHFVWKRGSGDVSLTADIRFLGAGKNPHRKAVLMIRQNLEADSPYADVALHGVGLTSLQYREEKGAVTREVQAKISAPKRVRIVKRGDYFTMWVAGDDGKFTLAGSTEKILLQEPFYVGIGVCSHDKDVVETAVFSNVDLRQPPTEKEAKLYSMRRIRNANPGE